jgi:tRNA dimethylallyltransferase
VRVVRALEVILLTDRRLSDLKRSHAFGDRKLDVLKICLGMEREVLYNRIDRRSIAMVEGGLVRETESLLAKGYSPDLKPMQAIGYRHMIQYLNGDWSMEKAISELQSDTRRYAKRQLTWFRSDPEVFWMEPEPTEMILEKVRAFLFENS